jgi:hypothetical protein
MEAGVIHHRSARISHCGMATVAIASNPLVPTVLSASRPVQPGTRIADIVAPELPAVMVRLDGHWILREHWQHRLAPGQHLEVHLLPQNSDALRLVLTIAAVGVLGPQGLAGLSGWQAAAAVLAANVAINLLLPVKLPTPPAGIASGEPGYSTALSGNAAALDQPIPVIYGRHRIYPPFAAQPYAEYDSEDDQYYHALMCIGMGEFDIETLQLDDTPLDHFADVQYSVLAPGVAPTLVRPNVVTAPEVSGQPLKSGRVIGGFAACAPRLTASAIGVDIVCERGLADATGSSLSAKSLQVRIDTRTVDDWGVASSPWATMATETITASTTSPVRRSYTYSITPPARVEVRIVRTDSRDANPQVLNDATWAGLRAYLEQTAALAANATHLELRMRASEQLNGLSQRRIAAIVRRKVRPWHPSTGWGAYTASRSIAWALADKWSNAEYGDGLPDSRIDLATLYSLHQTWEARQDRIDIVFDAATDSDQADKLIARAGRARPFWRNGVRSVSRDESQSLPVTAYTSRDITPDSAGLQYLCDVSAVPDAVVVEYLDLRSWDWRSVTCNAPGVTAPVRPIYLRLPGITGSKHAEREGLYEAAARYYRRVLGNWQTELQGLLPAFGSAVVFSPSLKGWGSAGDVVGWNVGTLTLTLSEPPTWKPGASHYISLLRDDGSLHSAIEATAGATEYEVVLASEPDFTPSTADARRERTRYHFGAASEHRRTMLVLGIEPQEIRDDGAMLVQMTGVLEDDRVHDADAALLPGVGEVQDPIDSPNTGIPGDGESYIVYLTPRIINLGVSSNDVLGLLRLRPDGSMYIETDTGTEVGDQWLLGQPFAPAPGALYEVLCEVASGTHFQAGSSAATGIWLALGSERTWVVGDPSWPGPLPGADPLLIDTTLRISIRTASTGLLQGSANVKFFFNYQGGN